MSHENVEIARRVYAVLDDGVNERTVRALIDEELADSEAELDLSAAYPDGPVVRRATLSAFLDSQPWGRSIRFEPEAFHAAGTDRVLVFLRLHGVGAGSGVEVEGRVAHLVTLHDRRVVRVESYTDRDKAREAAGLR